MSIPGVYPIPMNANITSYVEFNAFNNFDVCNKINTIIDFHKIVVVIAQTKKFYDLKTFFFALLSDEEKNSCNNFKLITLRDKYSIHRGILRVILSRMLNMKNSDIIISHYSHGKPFVENSYNLRFNLSHSDNYALYVFSLGNEVGVDIEEDINQININQIASLVLSPGELENFNILGVKEQRNAFFKLWTRKEALTKNYGLGMSMDFRKINLGIDKYSFENLILYDLSVANAYYAALALKADWSL